MEYLKSAFNYTGQKYPILEQIYKHFPSSSDVDLFVDVFCGGGSVFVNSNYKKIIANDIIKPLINFYKEIQNTKNFKEFENGFSSFIVDKNDPESFLNLRKSFNDNGSENAFQFFCLAVSCTNNMIRWNKKFQFNQTFGKRTYNKKIEEKLIDYYEKINELNVKFTNYHFTELLDKLIDKSKTIDKKFFVYLDPPYNGTDGGYTRIWSNQDEELLHVYLKKLDDNNINFALSGVSIHKGQENPNIDRLNSYKIIDINHNYDQVSRKGIGDTKEILVINY